MDQMDKILRETSPTFNLLMDMTPAAACNASLYKVKPHVIVSAVVKPLQTKQRVNGWPVNPVKPDEIRKRILPMALWLFAVKIPSSDRMTAGCVQNLMQAFWIVFPKLHFWNSVLYSKYCVWETSLSQCSQRRHGLFLFSLGASMLQV